jgi:hypothetical protein
MSDAMSYIAKWTKKRSTSSLRASLVTAINRDCECDGYVGFECSKHRRIEEIEWALQSRSQRPPQPPSTQ